jgi:MurNAc alpha-1-phosphate uridylyltransferase
MRDDPPALMIFAAGLGTRMGALTASRPKPLIPVAGRCLIDHALDVAAAAGIGRIVVNTHYLHEQITAHLAGRGIALSHEPEILETGGGLRAALPLLGGQWVLTLNSDAVWTGANPLSELLRAWNPDRADALLLVGRGQDCRGHAGPGDFDLAGDGLMTRGGTAIFLGAQVIKTSALEGIVEPVFSLNRVWDRLIAAGRLAGTWHDGGWCDVGRPEGIAEAEDLLLHGPHV